MAEETVLRKLAAIFYADVSGYSRLTGEDEVGTHRMLSQYLDVISSAIAEHGGRVVHYAGDAVLADFFSVIAGVECAVEIQCELASRNAKLPAERKLEFRIGISLGEVIVDRNDIYGDMVNVAARLESLADPGGICISRAVRDQIRDKLNFPLEDMGQQKVKNIARSERVFRVGLKPEAAGTVSGGKKPARRRWQWTALAVVVAVSAGTAAVFGWLRPWAPDVEPEFETAVFPQITRPTRHFKVKSPAELADADALTIYDRIRDEMASVYRGSGIRDAGVYQTWRRYNVPPYRSATHGRRYVNNYANPRAEAYGKFEAAGTLPEGSVLAKDSFEVTTRGDVVMGPLALMEKMQPGFDPESRDWRYTMIMPDGSVFGTTKGEGSERVEFCAECHRAAGDEDDHLFFMPQTYRVRFLNPIETTQ